MFKYPSSEIVEFTFTAAEKYTFGEPIEMTLKWLNKSQDNQVIMIRDYWEHPIGIGASIINIKTNDTQQKYTSRHILSSNFFLENELKEYEITLKPNESKTHPIHLNEIPYLENNDMNFSKKLPKGTYTAQINYYAKSSNELKFIIE